jgi:transposase
MASLVYYKNKKNGTTYVYENVSTWNKKTQRCDTKRKCIGKLDQENGNVLPTGKRGKGNGQIAYANVRCEGSSLLLDRLAESLSLPLILREAFPEEWDRILTCAYYLISEGKALSHVETWSAQHTHPYGNILTSQRVSELLQALTRSKQLGFFKQWARTRAEKEYMAMDITSVSSYSKQNEYVRYGYNRDGESLPQINLCMLVGEKSGIPVYFESINGSIKDVSTLENVLKMMDWLNASRIHAVMDRGFYSERNIDSLYDKHIRFTLGVPFVTKWSRELVAKVRGSIEDFLHYRRLGAYAFFVDTDTTAWKGHRCYRHVYYDSQKAAAEYTSFLEKVELWRAELEENRLVQEHQQHYDRFFIVSETPKRGRRVVVRDEEVQAFKEKIAGFFILISNDIKDPVQALKIYRNKDVIEKGFDNLKNALDMNRLRIHSAGAMQGRLFIQFIAQILIAAIHNVMLSSKLDDSFTLHELMNELKSFHSVRLDGWRKPIFTKLSKSQFNILLAFGISESSYV